MACGMVSQYNVASMDEAYGVKNLVNVVAKRLKMQGFIILDSDMGPKYADEHQKNVQKWSKLFLHQDAGLVARF